MYSKLIEYTKKNYSSFHTPGHKCAGFFPDDLLSLDLTELPDTDALYEADGIIRQTETELERLFNTKRSLISAGGCSLAIQAMLRIASLRGKKMLMARNSHRSAINAAALLDIDPVWLVPGSDDPFFTGRILPEDVEAHLRSDKSISACYITSPTYYGEISDIESIAGICHKYGVLLLVDNAHGSHLAFMHQNMHPIALGADMSACSLHKTMPVLTGGALLNIGNEQLVNGAKEAMALFGSTSPSYPVMASIGLCADYMLYGSGREDYLEAELRTQSLKSLASGLGILCPHGLCDPLRITLNTSLCSVRGESQTEFFHKHLIEPEFCDGDNAVLLCSPFNSDTDFSRLEQAIRSLGIAAASVSSDEKDRCLTRLRRQRDAFSLPERRMSLRSAMIDGAASVFSDDIGETIASDTVCPCPPGIPIYMPGEVIKLQ